MPFPWFHFRHIFFFKFRFEVKTLNTENHLALIKVKRSENLIMTLFSQVEIDINVCNVSRV